MAMNDKKATYGKESVKSFSYEFTKRLVDVLFGLFLLTVFAIPMLCIAVAIRLTDKGTILYKQTRIGRYGKEFFVFKFRTMYSDADKRGPLITSSDDTRITPIGKFLRDNKLDELPQFINVVKGDMSLVGPRPQVPRFVEHYPAELKDLVLSVRPGVTGPTQLAFRNEEEMLEGKVDREGYYIRELLPSKCQMDAEYVLTRSGRSDGRAVYDTMAEVFGKLPKKLLRRKHKVVTEAVVHVQNTIPEVNEEKEARIVV